MISYNWDDQEFCLKMKEHLDSAGYTVWMDVHNMHGSILDAMASAVENSSCVIMCISEKYKESKNCKLEAEYTHKSDKPIIPLIMDDSKPNGW